MTSRPHSASLSRSDSQANPRSTPLRIRLLGGFDVLVNDLPVTGWRSEKTKWLLAYLVLTEAEVTFAYLENLFWGAGNSAARPHCAGRETVPGDDAVVEPAVDPQNVRQSFKNLQDLLGSRWFKKPTRSSVRCDLPVETRSQIDVLVFDAAIRSGRLQDLRQAVAVYGGALIPDCSEPWLCEMREKRSQEYRQALSDLTCAAMEEGDYETAEGYSRLAVAASPGREATRCDLMRLLVKQGELQAAIEVYREYSTLLKGDPRARPGEAIQSLYTEIRTQQARLSQAVERPRLPEAPATIADPDIAPIDLVGREQALLDVTARILSRRLVTLVGPPGVGKTQLALLGLSENAHCFPSGTALVNLTELNGRRSLLRKLLCLFDVKVSPQQTEWEALTGLLGARQQLLVLDNCEHIVADCAPFVGELLRECPHLHILVTSRQALGLTAESLYEVRPLTLPPPFLLAHAPESLLALLPQFTAVQLFLQRARESDADFELTRDNAIAVTDLCRRLEGLPLAIEMLAAWACTLSPTQMLAQMADPLALLVGNCSDTPGRHQSLKIAIAASYATLSPAQQRLMARLSIFAGGWTLDAVERICEERPSRSLSLLLPELRLLQQRSLITTTGQNTRKRQRMLEPIRAFAREQLTPLAAKELAHRHATYCCDLIVRAEEGLVGAEQATWFERLEDDYANLESALEWACRQGETEQALQMAGSLWRYWYVRGSNRQGEEWLTRALTLSQPISDNSYHNNSYNNPYTESRNQSSNQSSNQSQNQNASHCIPSSQDALRMKVLGGLARLAYQRTEYRLARTYFMENLALAEQIEDHRSVAATLGNLANIESEEGRYSEASAHLERCLEVFRRLNERRSIALALGNLAVVYCRLDTPQRAVPLFAESIAILEELGDTLNLVMALHNLADLKLITGCAEEAAPLLAKSLPLCGRIGSQRGLLQGLSISSLLAIRQRDMERAAVLQGACDALLAQPGLLLPPRAAAEREQERKEVQQSLGSVCYEAAVSLGNSLTLEQAIATALRERMPDEAQETGGRPIA